MQTVTAVVARDPDACFRLFTDVTLLRTWVPGLRAVEVIAGSRAMPSEIHFEFGALSYTLVYTYDKERREVHWEPKLGPREGVTGFVRFDDVPEGTQLTYGLRHGDARNEAERELGDAHRIVDAFVARASR